MTSKDASNHRRGKLFLGFKESVIISVTSSKVEEHWEEEKQRHQIWHLHVYITKNEIFYSL